MNNVELSGIQLKVIRTPEEFKSLIRIEEAMDFLNSLVDEGALILRNKKVNLREETKWFKGKIAGLKSNKLVMIYLLKGSYIIGNCAVRRKNYKEAHNVEFGLAVRKEYRRKGYGELLLKKGIEEAFKTLKARNLWINYIEGNLPAKNLYEKLGFKEVCRLKDYVKVEDSYKDRIIMKFEVSFSEKK